MILKRKLAAGIVLLALMAGGIAFFPFLADWHGRNSRVRGEKPLDARRLEFRGQEFDVVKIDPHKQELRLFWKDAKGHPYRDFETLKKELEGQGKRLRFATNAGIFSEDHSPGGLHIENGQILKELNLRDGGGNFHLKPNGVFVLGAEGPLVEESQAFSASQQQPILATQSGPLLINDGKIHPEFREHSPNKHIRNGVGVDKEGMIWFAISNERVNFYDFAMLFLEELDCPDALYLDGTISQFFLPELERTETQGDFAGILAVVE